jgi:predicted secreted protein
VVRRFGAFVLLIGLVGCDGDGGAGGGVITPDESPAEVTVGDHVVIELDENGSVGDNWIATEPPDPLVLQFVSDEYVPDDNPEELVGVGGVRRFTYRAVGDGETSLVIHNCFRCDKDLVTPEEDRQYAVDEVFEVIVTE